MKKNILYLLAFITVIFAGCDPLKDTYNDIKPDGYTRDITITVAESYSSVEAANTGIVATLNKNYPQLGDGSKAFVSYNVVVKPADSLLSNISYTVTDADYLAINGNNFKNFAADKVLAFLDLKYPSPVANQLAVLSYTYYESGATSSAGIPAVHSFIYLNDEWVKAYQVTQAQYISAGKPGTLNFGSADEANLVGYFNGFLKADVVVSAKAKAGDIKYISFAYYNSGSRLTYQRIKWMTFDGMNWGSKAVAESAPLTFLKQDGKWIPDPTIYYTMVAVDYTNLNLPNENYTFGTAANRGNVAQYKSFNTNATNGTQWTPDEIKLAMIYTLNKVFPAAVADPELPYKITYYAYAGSYSYVTLKFIKTSTGFVFVAE